MSKRTYWLNVSGPEIGDNLVSSYDNKKELRSRWKRDAADFVSERGIDGDWYPYFQIENADGELEEVSLRSLLGNTLTGKRRAA